MRLFRRHNSTLRNLGILYDMAVTLPILKSLKLEVVLCQLRNAHVTKIEASDKGFDDGDASRIAEALRCDLLRTFSFVLRPHNFCTMIACIV